jgi:hypothetical protein
MLRSRRWVLVIGVLAGLLAVPSAAVAEHEDSHPEDTVFSFGYDDVNHVVAVNYGANDTLYVCGLENGPLAATYLPAVEGVIAVDTLEDADGVKTFAPRAQEELADDLTEESDPIEYSGADGVCGVSGVVVAGPNGQINHGQFMRAAKGLIDLKGHGCVVRYLAKSDIGRTDDTEVGTSDVDPPSEVGGSGEIMFSTFDADCSHGNKNNDLEAMNQGKKNRTDSPGKSGDAHGKNK